MRNKFTRKIVFALSLLLSIILLLVYLSSFLSPEIAGYLTLSNLLYLPLMVFLLVLFLVALILKHRKTIILLIVVFLAGITYHTHYFTISKSSCKNARNIRLMTYNVKVFNLYDWVKNVTYKKSIVHLIDSVKPDILCIQEYVSDDRNVFNTGDTILKLLGYKYKVELFNRRNKYFHFGIALFSKYPVLESHKILFSESLNMSAYYKLLLPGNDTVCLFNVHLQSIRFSQAEYSYLDSITENIEEEKIKKFLPISSKLLSAAKERARQADSISGLMINCKYKVMVCGDFNDVPMSYAYNKLSDGLKDAFLEGGNGLGATFTRFSIPFRIDYVLLPKEFKVCKAEVINKSYSDHYPLVVDFMP